MYKKLFFSVILAIALVFGMMLVGCGGGGGDSWYPVTDINQLDGDWKGSGSQRSVVDRQITLSPEIRASDPVMKFDIEMELSINAAAKTQSGRMKMDYTFSTGDKMTDDIMWAQLSEFADDPETLAMMLGLTSGYMMAELGPGYEQEAFRVDTSKRVFTQIVTFTNIPFTDEDLNDFQINESGNKIIMEDTVGEPPDQVSYRITLTRVGGGSGGGGGGSGGGATYTVWTRTLSYSEYSAGIFSGFLIDSGEYTSAELDLSNWNITSSFRDSSSRQSWTESQIKNYLVDNGFRNDLATERAKWLISKAHGFIADRTGSIVHVIIK
jgi:hypothetical protein